MFKESQIAPKEEKSKVKQINELYQDIKKAKGKKGAKIIFNEICNETPEWQVTREVENMKNIEESRNIALEKLEQLGFVFHSPEGQIICDLEKLKTEIDYKIIKSLGPIYQQKHLGDKRMDNILTLLVKNIRAISKDDYEKGIGEEKDLVYLPESNEDALDLEKIKSSRFHLLMSDLIKGGDYLKRRHGDIPTVEEDGEKGLDFREVILPVLIYHPDYGNGYRDEKDGRIYITDKVTGQPIRLTSEYIQKHWGFFGPHIAGENFAYPKLFVKKRLPRLTEAGLLTPEDFTTRKDERNRQASGRVETKIKPKGQVWFDGMDHMIGAEYSKDKLRAFELSPNLGGVADENNKLIAVFNLFKRDEKFSRTAPGSPRKYFQVKKAETNPRKFDKADFFPKRTGESEEEYQDRLGEYCDFKNVLTVSDELLIKENINLAEFSFKEQMLVATLYDRIGENKFLEFAHEYGRDGLKASAALESGPRMEEILLKIVRQKDRDPKFSARLVFRKFNELIREGDNIHDFIKRTITSREFTEKDLQSVTYNFEIKAREILEKYSDKISNQGVDEVEEELDRINNEMALLNSTLNHLKNEGIKFGLEDIRGLKVETRDIGEWTEENMKEFVDPNGKNRRVVMNMADKVYGKVFADNSRALAKVKNNFENRLDRINDYRVYMLTFRDELAAFMTMKPVEGKEGEVMAESFVVEPEVQKVSLGSAFAAKVMEREAEKSTVRGQVRTDNEAIIRSHEKIGFVFDREHPFTEEGVKYYWMRKEKMEK